MDIFSNSRAFAAVEWCSLLVHPHGKCLQRGDNAMRNDNGRKWGSGDRFEAYVRDRLVNYPHFFKNHVGDDLPRMNATVPGQFNDSGHWIDIMAIDRNRTLWIIEVSRGSKLGAGFVKHLGVRKDGNSQMSPAWRIQKKDKFLGQADATEKLVALFDAEGMSDDGIRDLFDRKIETHRVAVLVPEGCHVEGLRTELSFGQDIYTFFVSPDLKIRGSRH